MRRTDLLFKEEVSKISSEIRKEIDMSWAISDKIDAILKERGLSQKDFAKKMKKSEAEVSRWLGGTHNFTLRTIAKISEALNVNIISI